MTTCFVTGGAGFIGSHVCDLLLATGHRVVAIDDLSSGCLAHVEAARDHEAFTFCDLDVRSDELRTLFDEYDPEVVLHLAAQASVAVSMSDPVRDASINLIGSLQVLECARRTGVRKIVYAASGGTLYGEAAALPVAESAFGSGRPVSPYGLSKRVVIDYLELYASTHAIDWTALALANVYGPRQDPHGEAGVVAIFCRAMLDGRSPTIFGDGEQTRDYVFVGDVALAFARAAHCPGAGIVNVGTGIETSVNELYRRAAHQIGFAGTPEYAAPRAGDLRRSALDVARAGEVLGWEPATPLEEGLRQTFAALRGP